MWLAIFEQPAAGDLGSPGPLRQMIVDELTKTMHEILRSFARFLPRVAVMLVIVLVGWLIAFLLKSILRSLLRLARFDRLAENAGAAQVLKKLALPSATELLSRFVFWIAWLGFILVGVSVLEIVGLQEHIAGFFAFLPRPSPRMFLLTPGFLAASVVPRPSSPP